MRKKLYKHLIAIMVCVLLCANIFAFANYNHRFVDVPDDSYYAEAVQWAYENGITNGVDETHFAPDETCTRAQMITFLWRMSNMDEGATTLPVEETPEPTKTPMPTPPIPNPTIHPEYKHEYYGRMYIGDIYSVGLYDTLDQELVDMTDAGFIMKRSGGCYMIGDHDSEGLWIIRYMGDGDTLRIVKKDGTEEVYAWQRTDKHGTNIGYDVVDNDGNSCFHEGYDLFIATCNDSQGKDVTVTFWNRVD